MRSVLFGGFVFLFAGSLAAQSDSVFIRKIADEIFRNSTAYSNLYTLTKTIGQRLSGSPSTYTSEKWAQDAVKKAGADQVYLQKAMIPHWVRGGKDQAALIYREKPAKSGSIGFGKFCINSSGRHHGTHDSDSGF